MTIKQVAELAGVSPAAVSRYMNGGPLSSEKKNRIRRAIEETGYRPNLTARTMRTGIMRQIGVIAPKINSDAVSRIMDGISTRLRESDFMPVLGCTGGDPEAELDYLENMQMTRVAGVIFMGRVLTPALHDALSGMQVPVVVTGQKFEGFPCVYHDDRYAMKELTALMLRRGRRDLLYISAPPEDPAAGLARWQGAEEAVSEAHSAGIDVRIRRVIADFSAESGRSSMEQILAEGTAPDGVLCATDAMALGAMAALLARAYDVPGEVSVAGVGDSWAGGVSQPPLTTVRLDHRLCGEVAAELLLSLIEGDREAGEKQIRLDHIIVRRDSL